MRRIAPKKAAPSKASSPAIEYVNRKGEAYYLQSGRTKTGKPRYYLARKITGEPLERVPEGYEIRELPETAVVVLRKAKPTRILRENGNWSKSRPARNLEFPISSSTSKS